MLQVQTLNFPMLLSQRTLLSVTSGPVASVERREAPGELEGAEAPTRVEGAVGRDLSLPTPSAQVSKGLIHASN